MGLNDIRLPGSVVARLYQRSLVDGGTVVSQSTTPSSLAEERPEPVPETAPAWKYLGSNQRNILVVVSYPGVLHLPDDELAFLTRMLTACKLSLGDVAILNTNNHPAAGARDLLAFFKSKTVFLFGVSPEAFGLPVSFPQFQVQQVAGTTFLCSPPMEERHADELLKSKLWVCLKRIFAI